MNIAIYTLTSELHDQAAVGTATEEFLGSLGLEHEFKGSDFADYGTHDLDLIYVRTGGTEGIFRDLLPALRARSSQPFRLLTSGKSNSLAASMEILSFLRQQGLEGEIIHGPADYIARRAGLLAKVGEARRQLRGVRLGIIGRPSDWLISSGVDHRAVKGHLGIELVDIPMQELLQAIPPAQHVTACAESAGRYLPGANAIYSALRTVTETHRLQGFTLRCFDLLSAVSNTGCLALAKMNAEGYVAGCEGDIPAMLSMMAARALTGHSGFQANPASINPETGEMLFAHCTIPLDMVERYELDTHFESGIGVAIRGYVKEGPVTIFKLSGDLSRRFVAEGELLGCQSKPGLCRTQMLIRLDDKRQTDYFLKEPIGNHHIIIQGRHAGLFSHL